MPLPHTYNLYAIPSKATKKNCNNVSIENVERARKKHTQQINSKEK